MTTAPDQPLSVALVGTGMVADTHVAAIGAGSILRLAGIASRDPANAHRLADEVASRTGTRPRAYATVAEIASDPDIEAAVILTPPDQRRGIIEPLAAAGKHILLEKPVARNGQEAGELVSLCAQLGVTLGIVFQHRARAASRDAAALVASGRLGRLGLAEIHVPWWRDQSYYDAPGRGTYARDGGGVLITQAIHTLDLALSLTGPVAEVQAMTATTCFHDMEAEDAATAGLRFANGAHGSLTASTAAFPGRAESISLHFEAASLHLEAGTLTVRWRDGRTDISGAVTGTGGGADPMAFTHKWHQAILEDFAAAIRGNRPPMVSGQDALAVHRLIDAIASSARAGRRTEVSG